MSLAHTNALLVATTDIEHARRRAQAALTQVALLPEDAKSPLELQARIQAISGDLKAILARLASAESRVRIGLQEGETPTTEAPVPEANRPEANRPEATRPEVDRPSAPTSPWTGSPPATPVTAPAPPAAQADAQGHLYEDFEGVRIRVGAAKPRAGYVHWRDRRHVLGAALEVGVPAEVIHHAELMTQNQKPTALGWKRAEKLIVQVKEAEANKVAPDPLWARWLPTAK